MTEAIPQGESEPVPSLPLQERLKELLAVGSRDNESRLGFLYRLGEVATEERVEEVEPGYYWILSELLPEWRFTQPEQKGDIKVVIAERDSESGVEIAKNELAKFGDPHGRGHGRRLVSANDSSIIMVLRNTVRGDDICAIVQIERALFERSENLQ